MSPCKPSVLAGVRTPWATYSLPAAWIHSWPSSTRLASPKSAHALEAALVQVTNTTSNPAVTLDADKATRIPYVSSSQAAGPGGTCASTIQCRFDGFTVDPGGYRRVAQQIDLIVGVNSANPKPNGSLVIETDNVGDSRWIILRASISPNRILRLSTKA